MGVKIDGMTGKRFDIIELEEESYPMILFLDNGKEMTYTNVVHCLNALHEENEQFKGVLRELKEIGDYQADRIKELQRFEDTVFNSLNGKIKRGEKAIEWGESIGADVGAMGFHIELLKQFKKELSE